MSLNNINNETIEAGSEALPNDEQPHSDDRTGLQILRQAHTVLPDIENDMQAKEIVVKNLGVDAEKDVVMRKKVNKKNVKNSDVYSYYGQHMQSPLWVMFEFGSPPSGPGLEYDPRTRNDFVRVVLLITVLLYAGTGSVPAVVILSEDMMKFFRGKGFILALPSLIVFFLLHLMVCMSPCTRMYPCCIIILAVAALCMTLMLTWLSVYVYNEVAAYTLFSTGGALLICALISFTRFDFTSWVLFGITIPVCIAGVVLSIFIGNAVAGYFMPISRMALLAVVAILHTTAVTMELIQILNEATFELEPNEFFFGAYLLYTSPIDLCEKMIRKLF